MPVAKLDDAKLAQEIARCADIEDMELADMPARWFADQPRLGGHECAGVVRLKTDAGQLACLAVEPARHINRHFIGSDTVELPQHVG